MTIQLQFMRSIMYVGDLDEATTTGACHPCLSLVTGTVFEFNN